MDLSSWTDRAWNANVKALAAYRHENRQATASEPAGAELRRLWKVEEWILRRFEREVD